jgi:hypothetical protein
MDRRELLTELEKLISRNDLGTDDITLYILLLTNCIGSRTGKIGFKTIKNAIGAEFSIAKLHKSCQRLVDRNLITVTSSPDRSIEEDFTLCYTICSNMTN